MKNLKSYIMLIIVTSFFGLLFFIVATEMYLSLREELQPSDQMWTFLSQVLTGIIGLISGYMVSKND